MLLRRVRALLLALIVLLAVACSGAATAPTGDATAAARPAPEAATRTVEHVLGEVEVPAAPQRVVTLDVFAFEAAAVLDVPVVGAVANASMTEGVVAPLLEGVEIVGTAVGEPDVEAIAALDPDLILGAFPNGSALDDQLAAIAPTYLGIDFESSSQWKAVLLALADALGRVDDAETLIADFESRAAGLLVEPGGTSFATVRAYPDSVYVYGPDSFAGTIVEDAGLELAVPEEGGDGFGAELSYENLDAVDADAILFWTANEEDPEAVVAQLETSPLYAALPAAQAGRVAVGGQHWIGSGLIAADAVLDDIAALLGAE
jgi:iron complex transport system substrate-binding protein